MRPRGLQSRLNWSISFCTKHPPLVFHLLFPGKTRRKMWEKPVTVQEVVRHALTTEGLMMLLISLAWSHWIPKFIDRF